ncbi:hypothetical protein DYB37_008258 [Aphanomyces astaci]|uniref:Major facilitator superfamily (MFS) profile domain-containing protein n=1 Tax=Aphanomyces astaci TaxID=112090 RepID=A0A397DY48_APHAT|nr:hypothetical protein DYB30_006887 [Aphanomyces astaci]RHY98449.1 hypothetical protein DYB35_010335 [Aphanomyces astaci]RHZ18866.1 hypothetical protein DYB37_008258 [Aphanomyces astaci]
MVLPFFGGMLVDKFGVRSMALALSLLLLAGQIVFAVGCTFENFYLMLVRPPSMVLPPSCPHVQAGRMLFGLGGETMWVAQSTIVTLCASFWLIAISYVSFYAVIGPFNNVASSVLLERDYFQQPPPLCQRCGLGYYNRSFDCDAVSPHCPNVPPFAWPLPLLSQNCSITSPFDQFQCSKAPPYILDQDINCDDVAWREGPFTHRYCATKSQAAESATLAMSVMPLIVAVVAPLSGSVVDAVGLRPMLALAAEFLLVAAHVALAYTTVSAYKVLATLGVGACLFSCRGPECGGYRNCGLAIVPLVVAAVFNAYDAYIPHVEVVFIASAAWTLALGVALNALDMARGHVLNRKVLTEWHGGGTPRYFPPPDQDELDQPLLLDQEII